MLFAIKISFFYKKKNGTGTLKIYDSPVPWSVIFFQFNKYNIHWQRKKFYRIESWKPPACQIPEDVEKWWHQSHDGKGQFSEQKIIF